jgi:hypothetical protein
MSPVQKHFISMRRLNRTMLELKIAHRRQSEESRFELGAGSQPWIAMGERYLLLIHIAATVNASLCTPMKS